MLSDFRSELLVRGFDGFSAADLNAMINRGYFYVARKFPWYWKQASFSFPYPASGSVSVADTNANVTGFKNMRAVYLVGVPNGNSKVRLTPLDSTEAFDGKFVELGRGVTGVPDSYFINQDQLYLLPKLSSPGAATVEIHFNKRPAAMAADGAVPVTPVDLDEAILLAALDRCHKRALEPQFAAVVQMELEEFFDDMRDLEGDREEDLQERVRPDNSWA